MTPDHGGGTPPFFRHTYGGGNVLMHPESKIFPAQKPIISQVPWGGLSMLDRWNIHFKTRESRWKGPQGPGTLIYMSYWGVKGIFGPNIFIKQAPRAPPGLIRNQNTQKDTLNRLVMTPRPGDPYSGQLCPPEIFKIFRKIRNSWGVPPPMIRVH